MTTRTTVILKTVAVEIGLTDLPKYGGACAPPAPPVSGRFQICFIPIEISRKLMGYHGWNSIFMIIMISRKKLGVYENMNNTVISGIFFASHTNININFDLFCHGRSLSLLIYNVFKRDILVRACHLKVQLFIGLFNQS